jgi:hypothetical protein
MRQAFLILVAASALALGACGGDDNSGGDSGNAAQAPAGATGASGATAEKGATSGSEGSKRKKKGERSGSKNGSSGGSKQGSGSSGSARGGGQGSSGGSSKSLPIPPVDTKTKPAKPNPSDPYSVGNNVCDNFLPFSYDRRLKKGKLTPEKIARDYSRAFPEKKRDQAYKGCLAGAKRHLAESKKSR